MQMVAITRSAHMATSNPTRKFCNCILCSRTIEKPRKRYIVSEKTKFNASGALQQLPFNVFETHFTFVDSVSINHANEPLLPQEKLIVTELKLTYEKYARNASIVQHIIPLNQMLCVQSAKQLPSGEHQSRMCTSSKPCFHNNHEETLFCKKII